MIKKLLLNTTIITLFLLKINFNLCRAQSSTRGDVSVTRLITVAGLGVRIAHDKSTDKMYYSTHDGNIYEVQNFRTTPTALKISDKNAHGIVTQMAGLTVHKGVIYIAGSTDNTADANVSGAIKKAVLTTNPLVWSTVAYTEQYPKSNTAFSHRINAIEIDPAGQYIYLNSGSKSDHGEQVGGLRDVPLTAKIFRIPINANNLYLANNASSLAGYIFCEGIRNTFGLAFDPNGNLFGVENSGDRDHPEEMNWLQQGKHYGFPWTMGGLDNPQQFPSYNPGTSNGSWSNNPSLDPFIQASLSIGWVSGYFYNDPTFPSTPTGVTFTGPVLNDGPDADYYRDPADNTIKQASSTGKAVATFSPHLSPTGLTFDYGTNLNSTFSGDAFAVNYNTGGMATIFNGDQSGGALMHIDLSYDNTINNYRAKVNNIVKGFANPTDVRIINNEIYVIECRNNNGQGSIWKVTMPGRMYEAPQAINDPVIDGLANEPEWAYVPWAPIDKLWIDNVSGNQNTPPSPSDFSGRYKVMWKGTKLYILSEITDDVLDGKLPGSNPLLNYPDYDCIEVFLDEDNSGGDHTRSNQAFALHISTQGDAVDLCGDNCANWAARTFPGMVNSKWTKNGNVYTWEMWVNVYNNTYNELLSNNSSALVNLTTNKRMGFSLAYNDSDGSQSRRFMMGSNEMNGATNSARNVPWQNASVFGKILLRGQIQVPPPAFTLSRTTVTISSNINTTIGITLTPSVAGQNVVYTISPTNSAVATASINSVTGAISINYASAALGSQTYTVLANNGINTFSGTFSVTIQRVNIFTSSTAGIVISNQVSTTVGVPNTTVYPAGKVVYSIAPASSSLASASVNTATGAATLNYIPTVTGIQVFTITGNAGSFTQVKLVTLTVTNSNFFTLTTTAYNLNSNVNSTIQVTPIFSGGATFQLNPSTVNFAVVSFNSSTGVVSINYTSPVLGSQVFTLTGNNGIGTQRATFSVNVNKVNVFNSTLAAVSLYNQVSTTVGVPNTSNYMAGKVVFSVAPSSTSLAGANVNTTTGAVSINYTPSATGTQVFTVAGNTGSFIDYKFITVVVSDAGFFTLTPTAVNLNSDSDAMVEIKPVTTVTATYLLNPSTVPFADISFSSITGITQLNYSSPKLGSQVFTITGNRGAISYSRTFNVVVNPVSLFTLTVNAVDFMQQVSTVVSVNINSTYAPGKVNYTLNGVPVNFLNAAINTTSGVLTLNYDSFNTGNGIITLTGATPYASHDEYVNVNVIPFAESIFDFNIPVLSFNKNDVVNLNYTPQINSQVAGLQFSISPASSTIAGINIDPVTGVLTINNTSTLPGFENITITGKKGGLEKSVVFSITINDALSSVPGTFTGVSSGLQQQITVYPNPTNEKLYVAGSGSIQSYVLTDINGKEIRAGELKADHESKVAEVNLSNLTNGIYFIHIYDKAGSVVVKRIMKL